VGQVVGGQPLGPPTRRELVLHQDLLGPTFELGAAVLEPGLVHEVAPEQERRDRRRGDQHQHEIAVGRRRHRLDRTRHAEARVEHRGQGVLAVVGPAQRLQVGIVGVTLDAAHHPVAVARGPAPDGSGCQTRQGDERQDRLVHGLRMLAEQALKSE